MVMVMTNPMTEEGEKLLALSLKSQSAPQWGVEVIELPLAFDWTISRSSTSKKRNLIVSVEQEGSIGRGEVAFNSRYGESETVTLRQFSGVKESVLPQFLSASDLCDGLSKTDLTSSLKFGIESAFFDLIEKQSGVDEVFAGAKAGAVETSFSIPIISPNQVLKFIEKQNLERFASLKIKINRDGSGLIREVAKNYSGKLRIDANEAFENSEQVLNFFESLENLKIEFIEQPLPAEKKDEYEKLKGRLQAPVIADESVIHSIEVDFHQFFDGVNIKLMKTGSYIEALNIKAQAEEQNLKLMLGCMVETSLGISKAMNIAKGFDFYDLDGFLLLQKDPFGFVKERDGHLFRKEENGSGAVSRKPGCANRKGEA